MSLAKELGREYLDQFYNGAYFRIGDQVHKYSGHRTTTSIMVQSLDLTQKDSTFHDGVIPSDSIESMDTFAWPKLGYRELVYKDTKLVYYVTTARSAMRGLQDRFIGFNPTPVAGLLDGLNDPRNWATKDQYIRAIFNPKFTAFDKGMQEIKTGSALSFALSEDLCVSLSATEGPDRYCDVLYKDRVIGQVLEDNRVEIPHKIAKRASSIRLFQGKVEA